MDRKSDNMVIELHEFAGISPRTCETHRHISTCDLDRSARYSVPFVLGTPGIRGSDSTAIRSARAVALKMASAM